MEELKQKWEEWYSDMVDLYQWSEIDYKGKSVLCVSGCAKHTGDEGSFPAPFVQVIGCMDADSSICEEDKEEIAAILKKRHSIDNVTFFSS